MKRPPQPCTFGSEPHRPLGANGLNPALALVSSRNPSTCWSIPASVSRSAQNLSKRGYRILLLIAATGAWHVKCRFMKSVWRLATGGWAPGRAERTLDVAAG